MEIDTQSQQYQAYLTGLDNIRTFYAPKLQVFAKLPTSKQRLWLQNDPLLRKFIKLSIMVADWAGEFREDIIND